MIIRTRIIDNNVRNGKNFRRVERNRSPVRRFQLRRPNDDFEPLVLRRPNRQLNRFLFVERERAKRRFFRVNRRRVRRERRIRENLDDRRNVENAGSSAEERDRLGGLDRYDENGVVPRRSASLVRQVQVEERAIVRRSDCAGFERPIGFAADRLPERRHSALRERPIGAARVNMQVERARRRIGRDDVPEQVTPVRLDRDATPPTAPTQLRRFVDRYFERFNAERRDARLDDPIRNARLVGVARPIGLARRKGRFRVDGLKIAVRDNIILREERRKGQNAVDFAGFDGFIAAVLLRVVVIFVISRNVGRIRRLERRSRERLVREIRPFRRASTGAVLRVFAGFAGFIGLFDDGEDVPRPADDVRFEEYGSVEKFKRRFPTAQVENRKIARFERSPPTRFDRRQVEPNQPPPVRRRRFDANENAARAGILRNRRLFRF